MTRRSNRRVGFMTGTPGVKDPVRRAIAPLVDDRPAEVTDPAHRVAVEEGMAQLRRGEIATDEEVEATFRRYGA